MSQHFGRIKKPIAYGLLGFLLLAIVAINILRPWALALYHQVKGGMILRSVIQTAQKTNPNAIACDLEPAQEDSARTQLKQAIAHLEAARYYAPKLAQTYLLLGRAFCLYGELENAVSSYRAYVLLRPQNPLGHLEFGLANIMAGQKMSVMDWQAAGISPEQIYARADLAFASQQYDNAATWFQLAALLGGKPDGYRQFKWAVSNVLVGQPLPEGLDANAVSVYPLSQDIRIGGEYLQWMRPEDYSGNIRYGQRLYEHPSGVPGIGGLWWQGSGVAIIQVPCTAEYRILVRAIHKSTAGLVGQLQVENDLKPEAKFTLSEDWQDYKTRLVLTKGNHILGIRYVEDVGDALINWVSVEQMKDCEP